MNAQEIIAHRRTPRYILAIGSATLAYGGAMFSISPWMGVAYFAMACLAALYLAAT